MIFKICIGCCNSVCFLLRSYSLSCFVKVSTLESKLRESESRIEKMSHSTQEAESKAEQDSEVLNLNHK